MQNLYLPANAAFISPVDWAWISATVDLQGRPLLLPHTTTSDALVRVAQESFVAQVAGLSLIVDPSVPSGKVVVARTTELALYEGPFEFEASVEYGAPTRSVLLTADRYVAWAVRRPAGVCGELYADDSWFLGVRGLYARTGLPGKTTTFKAK